MYARAIDTVAASLNNMVWGRGGGVKHKTVKIIVSNFSNMFILDKGIDNMAFFGYAL